MREPEWYAMGVLVVTIAKATWDMGLSPWIRERQRKRGTLDALHRLDAKQARDTVANVLATAALVVFGILLLNHGHRAGKASQEALAAMKADMEILQNYHSGDGGADGE